MHFSPRKVPGPVSTVVLALGFCLCYFHSARSQAVPEGLVEGIRIEPVARAEGTPVRLAHDPSSDFLYYLTFQGDVYRLAPPYAEQVPEHAYSTNDHGLSTRSLGLVIDHSGTMFLVGNKVDGPLTKGVVMRGVRSGDGPRVWSRVAEMEPYPRSNTAFDHNFNAVAVSPDGQYLYINSGSRTDHGEEQSAGGQFPGMREVPLTAAIFRLPADANEIILLNDDEFLVEGGYIYTRGLRNSFSLAFNADGELFATENSGDRDDCDELNWIREGRHYGFPWRMGLNDNPQQFPGYNPSEDRLLNPEANAVQNGFFFNDPSFPPVPDGVTFTDPVINLGPDANLFRDPDDGQIYPSRLDRSARSRPIARLSDWYSI